MEISIQQTNTAVLKQTPKRVRVDPLEEENQSLRSELEVLKEALLQLKSEVEMLKEAFRVSAKSRANELEGVSRDPQEPQLTSMTSQPPTSVEKQTKTPQTRPKTVSTASNGSTVAGGPMKSKKPSIASKGRTVSFVDVVRSSTEATSPLVSSGQPNLSGLPNSVPLTPSQQSEGWTEVKSKSKGKPPVKVVSQPSSSLRSSLDRATEEEALKLLLRVPKSPEERSPGIVILSAKLPLTRKAQVHPMLAWKHALRALSGHLPLTISLISPFRAELFYDSDKAPEVQNALREKGYLIEEPPPLGEKDLVRRKGAYLDGFFLPLRRAALMGFDSVQQLKVLDLASLSLEKRFRDRLTVKQWKHQVAKDRQMIHPEESEGSGMEA
jgi:hypothetical protein